MTDTIVVARAVGTAWIESVTAPVRELDKRCVLVTTPLSEHQRSYVEPLVDDIVEISNPYDDAALAAAAKTAAGEQTLLAVVTSEDGLIVPAALAAESLGVARTPARAFELCRNKFLTRRTLEAAGLPGPRYALLGSHDGAEEVASHVGLPAVLKPVNGAGSHLVQVVRSTSELADAYDHAVRRIGASALSELYTRPLPGPDRAIDPTRTFLVESLISGHEYSVDVVLRDGEIEHVALADKAIVDDKHFECGFISPPLDLDPADEERIYACVDAALRAVGLDNSVAHVEVRDDGPDRTCIIEINAGRPGGQLLAQLFAMNTGVNMPAELLTATCGLPSTRTAPKVPMTLASLTKYASGSGRLLEIKGVREVEALPDILAVIPTVRVGDLITDEFEVFAVNMVAAGFLDLDDLMETYRTAEGLLELVVEPDEGCQPEVRPGQQ